MNHGKIISAVRWCRKMHKVLTEIRISPCTYELMLIEARVPYQDFLYMGIRVKVYPSTPDNCAELYDVHMLGPLFQVGPLWEDWDEQRKALQVGDGGEAGSAAGGTAEGTQPGEEAGGGR